MHVVAIHSIRDAEKFWGAAEQAELPDGVALHATYPNEDGSKAVCLWEADSVDTVRELVDDAVGEVSTNEFFEVNEQNADGLPAET